MLPRPGEHPPRFRGLVADATGADAPLVTLRHLRPGRFVTLHLLAVAAALGVGLALNRLPLALSVSAGIGLVAHAAEQAHRRAQSAVLERRYQQLVEEMPLSFYVLSLEERSGALFVSRGIVDLLGYSLEHWLESPLLFEDILHPLDSERVLSAIARAKAHGDPYDAEYRLYRRDGSVIWVQDRAVTVRDERGRAVHWQGFLVDVTARKQAEARYRTLVEQLPLITYIDTPYSADEAAAYVSPQIHNILGYSLEEWHGSPTFFVDHLHPEDRDRVREAQRAARQTGEPLTLEYRIMAADGRIVWLRDSYTVVRDETGRPWYTQGFAVDVSRRKQAERDRESLLTQAQEQNERLRKLDRMKDEFIALVSHELRTPLTSICGYLELLLQDDVMEELSEDRLNWLQVIDRNAERLLRLVEDLLLTAQASAGNLALDKSELDVAAVVEQAAQAGAPVAAARGIVLTCSTEPLPLANGDGVRLGQVVDNLVSNALKFTPSGGTVSVRTYRHNGAVRIEVADTGMGVSDEEQEHLFERFFRTARAQEEAIPGVGLGLSIAKAIVEAHDGRVSMRSAEGVGTTFFVDLPALARGLQSVA